MFGDPGDNGPFGSPFGTIAAGSGTLSTGFGQSGTVMTVHTPITLPGGDWRLIDNETNASISNTPGSAGNYFILEIGSGATIAPGNGNDLIADVGGGATIDAGNGNMVITAGGTDNVITAGTGNDAFVLGAPTPPSEHEGHNQGSVPITADTLTLGNGRNVVGFGGSGNTVYDGTGTDVVFGAGGGNDTFALNAGGGKLTIGGFSLTNGDVLDLSQILPGVTDSSLSSYVTLTSHAHHHHVVDTVLTISNGGVTDKVTLLNSGSITLSSLENSLHL
ncbi:MAG TPA: type I secretion C-terminal target domain-containing protein [Acidisphaera sp.]|nr:type I secretion C-terminal target domain-containing protein [Acidisphaera sp.]